MVCKWHFAIPWKARRKRTDEINQFLDRKISADIKENDIPAKVGNMMEEMK